MTDILTMETLEKITGKISPNTRQYANAASMLRGLNSPGGFAAGLNRPHRLPIYLGQLLHESHLFRYDREVWGPTPAQERYDTRTDLGNTPERDGDGFIYRGRGPIQITGRDNYRQFTAWCRKHIDHTAPDFVKDPDLVNTDPWEGLVAIWYWSTRKLNDPADRGDVRRVTRIINGGFNGLEDRERWTDRSSLILLGYARSDARAFQIDAGLNADGIIGPKTRAAMHAVLSGMAEIRPNRRRSITGKQGVAGVAVVGGGAAVVTYWENIVMFWQGLPCNLGWVSSFINFCGG